jgi:predicted molibdopterin-dependent oxidoreductase YjgC
MIRLTINGRAIETDEGKTILQVARENNIRIPTLCFHEKLFPIGSCRLCIVEVEGYANPVASCVTTATDGLSITTHSEKLLRMRRDYLKFLLIHHPLECPICDAGGECQLQDLVFEHQIEKVDIRATRDAKKQLFFSTPLIRYSQDRCVLCLRCVHACREVSGRGVLDLADNGIEAKMMVTHPEECISCGECLGACPVGSLTENLSPLKSRFWQVQRSSTTCPHCGFGCSFDLDVFENRYVTNVVSDTHHLPNHGSLCLMGRFGYDFVNHEARVTGASVRTNGTTRACTFDESVDLAADSLRRLDDAQKGVGFLVSARATNEEMYLIKEIAGLLKKGFVASPAYYHTTKVFSLYKDMGMVYPYAYDDLIKCDLIIIAGANLLSNNHLLANKVREAFKLNGARVIVVDPSPTALTRIADAHLALLPGRDGTLFNSLSLRLVEERKYAAEAGLVEGFAGFTAMLERWKLEFAGADTGVSEKEFEKAYRLIRDSVFTSVIFGSGISSSIDGLPALLNFSLLKGMPTKGTVMPVTCESNAAGACAILNGSLLAPEALLGNEDIKGLFVYQDDPFHYLNGRFVKEVLSNKEFLLAADAMTTSTMDIARLTVPVGTFAEKSGTFVAQDGYVRTLGKAMETGPGGFEFLRALLQKLGGAVYTDVQAVTNRIREKKLFEFADQCRERLASDGSGPKFKSYEFEKAPVPDPPYKLILRDIFSNHHLLGKDVYSKGVGMVCSAPGYPVSGDKLYIAPQDAQKLGVEERGQVLIESAEGSITKAVSIKKGLRQGVLEYVAFKERGDALGLAKHMQKVLNVTVKKA